MTDAPPEPLDEDAAWAAFDARDRTADGQFVVAVKTTGIYCRPSAARRPGASMSGFWTRPGRHARRVPRLPALPA